MRQATPSESELIAAISAAWSEVPAPDEKEIFTPHSYDDEGITEYFSGSGWQGHSTVKLRGMSAAISTFFAPKAFHYWLPAYLVAAVKDPIELSQGIEALLSALSPNSQLARSGEQSARLALLNKRQLDATIGVVAWLGEFFVEEPNFKESANQISVFLRHQAGSSEA